MASQFIVTGLRDLENAFETMERNARRAGAQEWWVGTIVEYAIYQHFGTRYIQGRQFFTAAINELSEELGLQTMSEEMLFSLISDDADFVATLAFELERRVKQKIIEMGVFDQGNLHASVAAAPSFSEMEQVSRQRATVHQPGTLGR